MSSLQAAWKSPLCWARRRRAWFAGAAGVEVCCRCWAKAARNAPTAEGSLDASAVVRAPVRATATASSPVVSLLSGSLRVMALP